MLILGLLVKSMFRLQGSNVLSSEVFSNSFLISISALPGNIWTIFHMDKLGRKFFLGKNHTKLLEV
jgi:hypothetical protein